MKRTIIGCLVFGAVSAFASDLPKQCKNAGQAKSYIEQKEINGRKINIVHVYGDSARDIYSDIDGDETSITEKGTEYIIKTQKNTEINCFREKLTKENGCTNYDCEI